MRLFVKLLHPAAKVPSKAHGTDAGYDLHSTVDVYIPPGATLSVPIGIATAFDEGYVALVWPRSSSGLAGIDVFAGVVDAGYRGEWRVVLYNSTDADVLIRVGDRVAQVLFQRVEDPDVDLVERLPDSDRGTAGWGSSGV